jgi:hypothetical protein
MHERPGWMAVQDEPEHPLAALEGQELAGGRLRVRLGPTSRFGARYFILLLERSGEVAPVLAALHHSGPYPSYNWIEVSETDEALVGDDGVAQLFARFFDLLPPGGHLMVEYDSPRRAETAQALARGVPAIATPLGSLLFDLGFGAKFKDWQIAEGGAEGPRKLQAYKPPAGDHASRWRDEARADLRAFLSRNTNASEPVRAARERAQHVLEQLERG